MTMLHWFPLEPLAQRYTEDWYSWFPDVFKSHKLSYVEHFGSYLSTTIETGEFLDVHSRPFYAMSQIMSYVKCIKDSPSSQDTLLFADLWHHGIESVPYIRDLAASRIKVYGVFHAGSYDPYDFLALSGCGRWARHFEKMVMSFVDGAFVGSEYSKLLLSTVTPTGQSDKIHVTGLPVDYNRIRELTQYERDVKEPIIVFPHRLAPEKDPIKAFKIVDRVLQESPEAQFCVTTGKTPSEALKPNKRNSEIVSAYVDLWAKYGKRVKLMSFPNKEDYLRFLGKCTVMLSTSRQETFGYGTVESMAADVVPVVPRRLSYPELVAHNSKFLYATEDEAVEKVVKFLEQPIAVHSYSKRYQYQDVVRKMLEVMDQI